MTTSGTAEAVSLGGRTRITKQPDWAEQAEGNSDFIRTSLATMGMSGPAVEELLGLEESRERSVRGVSSMWTRPGRPDFSTIDDALSYRTDQLVEIRHDFLSRVRDLWDNRRLTVEESRTTTAEIPLFLLTAPAVSGCSVELESADTSAAALGWDLKVFGTGLSGGVEATTSISADFVAAAGEARQAFLPVQVKTDKVTVHKKGRLLGHGLVHSVTQIEKMHPGARPADPNSARRASADPDVYPLERDLAAHLNTYVIDRVGGTDHTLSIGFSAFGQDATISVEVGLRHEAKLTCKLPGGHRYLAYPVESDNGILWEVRAG